MKYLTLHRAFWVGLAILATNSGCTHNYYYGAAAGCPPIGQTVTTQLGQVCDAPSATVITSANSPPVSSNVASNSQVVLAPNTQRVVVSQPAYNTNLGSRLLWRRPSPENIATTRVEGALE